MGMSDASSARAVPIDILPAADRRTPHDDARQRGNRLADAVRSWFGGKEEAPAPELTPVVPIFQRVGQFFDTHQLEPTPPHYELVHGYLTQVDRKLVDAVDRAIARMGRLTPEAAELILGEVRTDMSAEMLAGLIDKAQTGLTHIAGLAKQSGADAKANCTVHLPYDVVVATEFRPNPPTRTVNVHEVGADEMILDVGPAAVEALADVLKTCRTLVWNGPMGAFETPPFDTATVALARTAAALTKEGGLVSVAGGGDTVAALNHAGVADDFTFVSTAGGAFLEWMEGCELPGVAALTAASPSR